jgi:hypothetical protein
MLEVVFTFPERVSSPSIKISDKESSTLLADNKIAMARGRSKRLVFF